MMIIKILLLSFGSWSRWMDKKFSTI